MNGQLETGSALSAGEVIAPPVKYRALRRYFANKAAVISLIFIVVFLFICFFPNLLTKFPQNDIGGSEKRLAPNSTNWLGTDLQGRDLFTEVLHGGQISLRIAIVVALLSTFFGSLIGAMAGYFNKFFDAVLMRITDLFLVVPQIVILAIALKKFGDEYLPMVIVIASITWMYTARLVRSQVLTLKKREYIDASIISGRSSLYIIFRHLIPNSWSVIAVSSAFTVAAAIALESTVSFLGFGVQPPLKSLGSLLDDLSGYAVGKYYYLFLAPAMTIFLIVFAFNFISDGLRDAFDPKSEQL